MNFPEDFQGSMSEKSEYRVLARKYRPQRFADLIGQEPMVRTLSNAFASGRIAQAYMLTGVRGVGKTTTARILARALNYKTDSVDEPNIALETEGEHCRAIIEGRAHGTELSASPPVSVNLTAPSLRILSRPPRSTSWRVEL